MPCPKWHLTKHKYSISYPQKWLSCSLLVTWPGVWNQWNPALICPSPQHKYFCLAKVTDSWRSHQWKGWDRPPLSQRSRRSPSPKRAPRCSSGKHHKPGRPHVFAFLLSQLFWFTFYTPYVMLLVMSQDLRTNTTGRQRCAIHAVHTEPATIRSCGTNWWTTTVVVGQYLPHYPRHEENNTMKYFALEVSCSIRLCLFPAFLPIIPFCQRLSPLLAPQKSLSVSCPGVLLPKLVEHLGAVGAAVLRQCHGDHLETKRNRQWVMYN